MAALLDESFDALAADVPAAYARMVGALAGRAVAIRVDDEAFTVRFTGGRATVTAGAGAADVVIETGRATILDLLEARRTLADAVRSDAVAAVAPLPLLVEVHDGLSAYVHGAVRSPSFPGILRRFHALGAPAASGG